MVLVVARDLGGRVVALRGRIPDLAGFAVKGVYGTFKEVIRNPVNVAAVRKPLAPRGDVVGRALTLGFNEKRQRRHVLQNALPRRKRRMVAVELLVLRAER